MNGMRDHLSLLYLLTCDYSGFPATFVEKVFLILFHVTRLPIPKSEALFLILNTGPLV